MDAVVPPEITAELTQILSNLVLGDNEIRSNAEKAVNERLEHTPELYLLALSQFAISADTELMRSFSLVLLRRLLFRSSPSSKTDSLNPGPRLTLYDHLSNQTISTIERLLLYSLLREPSLVVRHKTVDTICDLANHGMTRGRPWHALQVQTFSMTDAQTTQEDGGHGAGSRECAYKVFAGSPNLITDLQPEEVISMLSKGLRDSQSVEVRHAALLASVAFVSSAEPSQLHQTLSLIYPMLDTLPPLLQSLNTNSSVPSTAAAACKNNPTAPRPLSTCQYLTKFLETLTPLCSTHPTLFQPHIQSLLMILPQLILPPVDCGPTPTVTRPFPNGGLGGGGLGGAGGRQGAFVFPPPGAANGDDDDSNEHDTKDDERVKLRLTALEFMISLSEARPVMVKKVPGWTEVIVRACLEGMGELDEGREALEEWLKEDPGESLDADTTSSLFEQSLDRLACALGGREVLYPAFQYIPSMMASYDWRVRHAGLSAIAAIAEGTGKVMQNELGKVIDLILPMFKDIHPRVRHAACQCLGQLCTDLEEVIQEGYHQQLFSVLIPTLEDPEPRVHSHAAAALINFCEGVERETLLPYLDPIVERLLRLLNPNGDVPVGGGSSVAGKETMMYVQEQAITTLAMVADASEHAFGKHYATIMPLLLNVLRNANGPDHHKLRAKAMECAGLIAIAVGYDVFRHDATALVECLIRIQQSQPDPTDPQLNYNLIATWSKACQAMGPEFEPYLPVVMPNVLTIASAKADISIYDDEENPEEREGWEVVSIDGRTLGIRTSAIEEKCQAFETLVIYCSTLGPRFAPYLAQCLELTLPSLKFYFHDGVREACAMLIPMLLSCGKHSGTLTPQMVSATFHQLIMCIKNEFDTSFLASLYKCLGDSLLIIGTNTSPSGDIHATLQANTNTTLLSATINSILPHEFVNGINEVTSRQLQTLAEKRRSRSQKTKADIENEKDDIELLEEIEGFALEDMARALTILDPNHQLLVAISGVKSLGLNLWESEEDE
ncbi:hypothetical protein AX16_010759 [Volvariella volvacea WC 439]|nr:hypothetical protein AX16_010759 [Volvariella volvacea WC 439]